ncbi:MAG: redoxin domain-containing protein [Fibrobacter sp.]|jgi:thiol-disulfide isomerase/thioredoxin|nr:redoxin domain-containing protein [Fibrobacter sp.]
MVNFPYFYSKLLFILLWGAASISAAPWLGFSFKKSTYENHLALEIQGVHPLSGGIQAGIQPGDKIIGVGDGPLTDMAVIQNAVAKAKTGEKLTLEILRNGKKTKLSVILTERPDDVSELTGSLIGNKAKALGENFYANRQKVLQKPKLTLLDFWATWCLPCRKTSPILARLYQKYAAKGFEIIGISTESEKELAAFEKGHAHPYPMYRDGTQTLWRHYGISAVPTLLLLDSKGYIIKNWNGAPNETALEKLLREYLE